MLRKQLIRCCCCCSCCCLARRLSGRAEPVPAVREEEGKDSDDAPAQRAANPVLKRPHADKEAEERKQSELTVALQQDTTAAVSAARARFLARKKVKH